MSKKPKTEERYNLEQVFNKKIANHIKTTRQKRKLSLNDIVSHSLVHVTTSQLRAQEHGKVNFTITDLCILSHVLKQDMQLNIDAANLDFTISLIKKEAETNKNKQIKQPSLFDKILKKFTR